MNNWIFRKSKIEDLHKIYQLIDSARNQMRSENNFQWTDQYPAITHCQSDIQKGYSYVMEENGEIIGSQAIIIGSHWYYTDIDPEDKYWLVKDKSQNHGIITRLVVSTLKRGAGIGTYLVNEAEKICRENKVLSMRVLVGPDNTKTQKMFQKLGFLYLATIEHTLDKEVWMMYQKVLKYEENS